MALAPVVPKIDVGDEFLIGKNDVEQLKRDGRWKMMEVFL